MITTETYISSLTPGVIQFENANEGRSYPFSDETVLEADNGLVLPDNIISDLHITAPKGCSAKLSSVYISKHMVSVCISITKNGTNVAALSCVVKTEVFEPYIPYRLEKLTGSEDVGGVVTFGQIDFADSAGSYKYTNHQVEFADSTVLKYTPAKLRKIIDDRTGESVNGDVAIDFSAYIKASKESDGVKLSLTENARKILLSDCDKNRVTNPCGADPIEKINGIESDSKKRIVIWFH